MNLTKYNTQERLIIANHKPAKRRGKKPLIMGSIALALSGVADTLAKEIGAINTYLAFGQVSNERDKMFLDRLKEDLSLDLMGLEKQIWQDSNID